MRGTESNKFFETATNLLLGFFFPSFCTACKTKLADTEKCVCKSCISKIQIADSERMEREFYRKFSHSNIISAFQSAFVFEKDKELQDILHALKYYNKFQVGKFLGGLIANQVGEQVKTWNADMIIPVPLHSLKKAERGYNQSELICKGISKVLSIPTKSNVLKRSRYTLSQTTMTLEERKENVHKAFVMKKNVTGKRIIIVDDVLTTGATITECGRVLKENGAEEVYALSVAIVG